MMRFMVLGLVVFFLAILGTSVSGARPQDANEGRRAEQPEEAAGARVFNVRAYGAIGDGKQLDTAAIQAAIDACSSNGGGMVLVPSGTFLTGTLCLKNNVNLHLVSTAVILGSTDLSHYATNVEPCGFVTAAHINKCLLYAEDAENISLTGRGVIDGQGSSFADAAPDGTAGERPMLARFARCRHLLVTGLTLKSAGAWCTHFLRCANVRVQGVTILNRAKYNNDGIDLMSTQDVMISDCLLLCEDDAICFQDMSDEFPVRNVVVTNCVMSTRWAAIRSGGAHRGGIRNVTVSNCVIHDTLGCGIKLQISGNGTMEDMTFSNIVMTNVSSPISLRLGNHHYNNEKRDEHFPFGGLKNIMFENIRASVVDPESLRTQIAAYYPPQVAAKPNPGEERQCISICGIPDHPVEGVTLSNIHVTYPGGGTQEEAARRDLPELEDLYPEYFMFGVLPAYGLYARHVRGLTLHNVQFELTSPDARPAVTCDDAANVEICGLKADGARDAESLIRLRATRGAFIHESWPLGELNTFVRVEGETSRDIKLINNNLDHCRTEIDKVMTNDE
jgi:hypothetical protein